MKRHKTLFFGAFSFIALKYVGYTIAFFNQLLFISIAGAETYGTYSFFILILAVAAYSNGGVHFSYVVLAASRAKHNFFQRAVFRSALKINALGVTLLALAVVATHFAGGFELEIFAKYSLSTYIILVFSAYFLKSFSLILMSRERVRNCWGRINVYYILPPLFESVAILLSAPENIVFNVLIGLNLTHLTLIVYFSPLRELFGERAEKTCGGLSSRGKILRRTFSRGMEQNFYNLSFYGILLLVRGLAADSLSTEDFGRFSFALNLSTAVILFVGSVQFLVQPNILASIATMTSRDAFREIFKLRRVFQLFSAFCFFFSCLALLVIGVWSEPIKQVVIAVQIMLLAQLIYENSYGVNTILIQRNKERGLTYIGFAVIGAIWIIQQLLPAEISGNPLTFYIILIAAYVFYSLAVNLMAQLLFVQQINWARLFEPETLVLVPLVLVLLFECADALLASLTGFIFINAIVLLQHRKLWAMVKSMLDRADR